MLKVLKRDGSTEDYEEAKITRVAVAAGLEESEAEELSKEVTKDLESLNTKTVSSLQIRDFLVPKLKTLNPQAADLFIWYEKTKEPKN